ncbi:MAG: hypothetical protein KKG78_12000 [Alphaproteobacteria bacterium]|nr:hypothetical protein [Alphaproteobacteria bacterium]
MTGKTSHKTEVFQYTDEFGIEQWLDVASLRRWAEENCELFGIPIDIHKVEDMFANGRIDEERLRKHTMKNLPRPVIVCEGFISGGASEIVDGNHTYVAMATALALAEKQGIRLPGPAAIPGYVVTRAQMERFLIPPEMRKGNP